MHIRPYIPLLLVNCGRCLSCSGFAVIENLRRVSEKIALDLIDHDLADYWADKMIASVAENPGDLILVIADMARSKPSLSGAFVAAFTRKLQGKECRVALSLNWMEQQLVTQGFSSEELVGTENQKQAALQVSVRNSIGTLRLLVLPTGANL